MKKSLLFVILLSACFSQISAQDIPLFSQKLTNSFMYNPALAGHTFGSLTISHRDNYSGVEGSPVNNYLSFQTPISNYRFGAGVNIYQEEVNILKNSYYSAAFAYHLHFNKFTSLSMGVSGEYNTITLNNNAGVTLADDLTIQKFSSGQATPDFSFGMLFQNRFLRAGFAANRLATSFKSDDKVLTSYYSTFISGRIPLRNGSDLLEPYVTYRRQSALSDIYDIGLYYTYNNKITLGGATRKGDIYSATLAYRINKSILIGYSRETIAGAVSGFTGSSNEFTLRFDFKDKTYQEHFRDDYKTSVSYRRKTLTTGRTVGGGAKSAKQLQKAQKRVAAFSPNARYQNNKKLSMGKKSVGKPKSFKSKKRKPVSKKYKRRK